MLWKAYAEQNNNCETDHENVHSLLNNRQFACRNSGSNVKMKFSPYFPRCHSAVWTVQCH